MAWRWGDFGGHCLASACQPNADLYMPDGQALGLVKSASYLLGTWRTADGSIHRFLRGIQPFQSASGCFVFSNRGVSQLQRLEEIEEQTYRGAIATSLTDAAVTFAAPGKQGGFLHTIDDNQAQWREVGLLDVTGDRFAPSTQWYNPWRDGGGGFAVTTKFRANGRVFDEPARGFFAHEAHFFPIGRDFFNSPYGWGGREVHWGHMATAFDDGSTIDASLAWGPDGWGFALLVDEQGVLHATTELMVGATLRSDGYPERISYTFLDQSWEWRLEPHGARAATREGGIIGAEGVLRRVGETRNVSAAMGTIDWWRDGRADQICR